MCDTRRPVLVKTVYNRLLLINNARTSTTPRLYDWTVSSEHLGFYFVSSLVSLFGSVRQIKLAIR